MDGKYRLVRGSESKEDLECSCEHDFSESPPFHTKPKSTIRALLPWVCHAFLLLVSSTLFVLSVRLNQEASCSCSNAPASILGKGWDEHTHAQRFNGSFKLPATYKGPPRPSVDEAWEEITPMHLIRIKESEFQNLNASKYAAEIPDSEGGRVGIFEAFHMIHCLKSLWQNTYPEYYTKQYAYNQAHQQEWHEHADHCTDMIRQKLMCDADASVITYNWLRNHYYPHPNFNVQHQCRDYGRLLEVAEERKIKGTFLRPEGKSVVEFGEVPFDPDEDS